MPENVLHGFFCRERFPLRLQAGSEKKEAEFPSDEDTHGFGRSWKKLGINFFIFIPALEWKRETDSPPSPWEKK